MTLIEGIGDEVIQVFVALIFIVIATLAWYTTNISNEGTLRTVFLLERRRSRRTETNTTVSASVVEESPPEGPDINQSVSLTEDDPSVDSSGDIVSSSLLNLEGESRIVEAMDAPDMTNEVGRSRLSFDTSRDSADNLTSDNQPTHEPTEEGDEGERINVKLKYLNEEIKQVEGRLLETLGSFKRRNFQFELSNDKLIKLIFNGRVLESDSTTLQRCGFFDNCVVHCLVQRRNQRPLQPLSRISDRTIYFTAHTDRTIRINQAHEWHLENYLFGILCCFLGAAWYLRYVYAHLYTVTATIGLILMTGIFTIIMYGMHFPDNSDFNQQRSNNVESPQ
ncbi:hypothetical protein WA026_019752 [Henosepilachna vigintioctopunctata]|uniref:Ubiquitin-like domain-containing protein n=1 Tax=Henosepilachna vigintioctopunctata TaxID=420089 RepID=A0AAW1UM09_9CUCU